MNKRVVTFLSLFSLVLVLSIYYVMLPSGSVTPSGDNNQQVGNIITNADDPYIEGIILERTASLQEDLNAQLDIMASSDYTASDKAAAAEAIERIEYILNTEAEMRTSIKELGFPSAFVEIKNDDVEVLAISQTKTKHEVMIIIDCIDSFFADERIHQVTVHFR